jgi:hypothetical protein
VLLQDYRYWPGGGHWRHIEWVVKLRFAEIEGSREWTESARQAPVAEAPVVVVVDDVENEARRRLRLVKLDEWRTREMITGRPMPESVRQFALQVDYARQALSMMSPIPADFDSDVYWPMRWDR